MKYIDHYKGFSVGDLVEVLYKGSPSVGLIGKIIKIQSYTDGSVSVRVILPGGRESGWAYPETSLRLVYQCH